MQFPEVNKKVQIVRTLDGEEEKGPLVEEDG